MKLPDKILRTLFTAFFFIAIVLKAGATTAEYEGKNYSIKAVYNREIEPGDPVFFEAKFILKDAYLEKSSDKQDDKVVTGELRMVNTKTGKTVQKSELFSIGEKNEKNSCLVMALLPTSTYLENSSYEIHIEYRIFNSENSFSLPLVYKAKKFIHEDIPLDSKNTAIKSDMSEKRMEQIKRLNAILDKKNYGDYKAKTLTSFSEPLTCSRRTSFFGDRRTFIYVDGSKVQNLHYGIDYGVKTGTNVCASGDGKVVMAENRISTGWSVCIEHLPGLYSLYYHMDSLDVKSGDVVKKGQLLGKSGCTGLATGPHLHWEMRLNMEAVNPDWFVKTYPAIFLQEKEKFFRQ